jgi:outer membrane receptor for ferrienterochelin and colicins
MKVLILFLASLGLFARAQPATVRVEVTSENGPVQAAEVSLNGQTVRTGPDGIATAPIPVGPLKIRVSREGFLTSTTTLDIDMAREWVVSIELQPAKEVEEEITVYATRNDVRIQDAPVRVEVLQREEIEEKMLMTPGDIVMMLNEMGGMRVQTTSPSLGAASVRMQGMRGRYTRFLSDGLPLLDSRAPDWDYSRFRRWTWVRWK